jgi:hypothetical protein
VEITNNQALPSILIIKLMETEDEEGVIGEIDSSLLYVQYLDDDLSLGTNIVECDAIEFAKLLPSIAPDYNWDAMRKLAGLQISQWLFKRGLLSPEYDYSVELYAHETVLGLYNGLALFRSPDRCGDPGASGDSSIVAPWARTLL